MREKGLTLLQQLNRELYGDPNELYNEVVGTISEKEMEELEKLNQHYATRS